jgi:hypothetical protein
MPSAAVIKEAEKINDANRRTIAQGLGISDAEYNYIINTRNKVAADVHIDFDDDGKPIISRTDMYICSYFISSIDNIIVLSITYT